MTWSIDYMEENGIVQAKTSGPMTWDTNKKLSEEVLSAGRKKGVKKFFVDHRDMELNLSILEIDKLPEMFKDIGVSREDRVAILFNPSSPKSGLFSFFQNVSLIRSLQLRVFCDADEAIAWLKSDSPVKPIKQLFPPAGR